MRITVTRSGGFAGLTREWTVQVSRRDDENDWQELLDRLPWDGVRAWASRPAPEEPDRFVYRVRCANREATLPERRVTGPWRELVDRVQQSAESHDENEGHPDE